MRLPQKTIQVQAFLDMLAVSEIGEKLLKLSDNGYNVLVGSTWKAPLLFPSYVDHPRVYNAQLNSTAAGRYQIIYRTWSAYKKMLGLKDFGHESQDKVALRLIAECKAVVAIENGRIADAIALCQSRWASLPGPDCFLPNGKPQPEQDQDYLLGAFQAAGGKIA